MRKINAMVKRMPGIIPAMKSLPIDYLKIDGAFVREIVNDPIDYSMVKSINDIGHVMKKKTIIWE